MGFKIYEGEKIDALCEVLGVSPYDLHLWSDNSITVRDNDRVEYYVTKGIRKYNEKIGRKNGYNIYKQT
jgi:hypothetical protein